MLRTYTYIIILVDCKKALLIITMANNIELNNIQNIVYCESIVFIIPVFNII